MTPEEEKKVAVTIQAVDEAKRRWIEAKFDQNQFIPIIGIVKEKIMKAGISEQTAVFVTKIGIMEAEMIRRGDRNLN